MMHLFMSLMLSVGFAESQDWADISTPIADIGIDGSKDSALIIAIEDYAFIQDVKGAVKNGRDWLGFFETSMGISSERVVMLSNTQAINAEILRQSQLLSEKTPAGGRIWLVYVGHGANYKGKPIFLNVAAQQTEASFSEQLIQQDVLDVLLQQHDVVGVIDACFSGKDNRGMAFLSNTQAISLESFDDHPKLVLLTAGKSTEYAGDLPNLGRPAFSYLSLGALRGWGDEDKNGEVTLGEVVSYSKKHWSLLYWTENKHPKSLVRVSKIHP